MLLRIPYRRILALLGAVTVTLAIVAALPKPAEAAQIQAKVDAYLAAYPGGRQINATEIEYGNGAFIVDVVPAPNAVEGFPDCPSGWFCFYDYVNFGYPRGKLSDCGWQDLGWWGWQNRTDSVNYAMSTGSVTFVGDGNPPVSLFSVSTSKRSIANVDPYRNQADFVYRYC
jgi:hypothetical protein